MNSRRGPFSPSTAHFQAYSCAFGSDYVHSVDLRIDTRQPFVRVQKGQKDETNPEVRHSVAASVIIGVGGAAGGRSTHTVRVVLADEDSGEIPQLGLYDT